MNLTGPMARHSTASSISPRRTSFGSNESMLARMSESSVITTEAIVSRIRSACGESAPNSSSATSLLAGDPPSMVSQVRL